MKVLNYGSLNVDYTYSVPHIVVGGETMASFELHEYCGGKGLNQSVALAAGCCLMHVFRRESTPSSSNRWMCAADIR